MFRPLTRSMTLTFQSQAAMTHTHAKDHGQRSVGSKERVEMDGRQMDGADCITVHANAVGKIFTCIYLDSSAASFS